MTEEQEIKANKIIEKILNIVLVCDNPEESLRNLAIAKIIIDRTIDKLVVYE